MYAASAACVLVADGVVVGLAVVTGPLVTVVIGLTVTVGRTVTTVCGGFLIGSPTTWVVPVGRGPPTGLPPLYS